MHDMKFERVTMNVMREGGRLADAEVPFDAKLPAIFPKNHRFTRLFVEFLHRFNLHAGPKVLISLVRQKLWIVNVRELAKKVVHECPLCFRYMLRLMQQIMGNIPADRLCSQRPFLTGVDFCGPFMTSYRLRGKSPYKSYAAVFV